MFFKSIKLYKDKEIELDNFVSEIVRFGYENVKAVSEEGDFSRRGGIIDIFPLTFECPIRIELFDNIVESIYSYDINTGEKLVSHDVMIILPKRETGKYKLEKDISVFNEEVPIDYFVDLNKGDYIVHVKYGIGKFQGVKRLKDKKGNYEKYLCIEYADKEKLYVPYRDMHLVQKFIGIEGRVPKIYKLGSKQWDKIKKKTKEKIWNLAGELLELQAKRSVLKGYSFSKDTDWQRKLEEEFPYEETPGQIRANVEVKRDMESIHPMDRLLCGDVGYGKTEVALRAAFKAVMDNKQVAMLVPTTILAEQHFYTFSERLSSFPVNIKMLSRFISSSEQKDILNLIKHRKVDIIIGTHRLLSDDIRFKNLGLVIIDEEQRFGVKHKEKLKHLRLLVDILTLTATPIPRTLYMSLMGVKNMSIIDTPPKDRIPISTMVTEFDEDLIKRAVLHEVKRGGQIYFVHNRVYDIEDVAAKLKKLLPDIKIGISHGQMANKDLEKVILDFLKKKIDLLVTTTIIQSGIDIPNVNTLIVDRADTFGLGDLYQLKGRVGRFKQKAYAYLLVPQKKAVLTESTKKRLKAIQKHTELGAGFKIAMKDLMIRGAGNLLGPEQHGYIMNVGFDLYCRLLREAVSNLAVSSSQAYPEIMHVVK